MTSDKSAEDTNDYWLFKDGLPRDHYPEGGSGVWTTGAQFQSRVQDQPAIWAEVAVAFDPQRPAPLVFVGQRAERIEFLLFHHVLAAEVGLWLAPDRRCHRFAARWRQAAIARLDWSRNPLLMATCPTLDSPSVSQSWVSRAGRPRETSCHGPLPT